MSLEIGYMGVVDVDENCHPYTILVIGRKNLRWYAAIGDNLNDKWGEWNPPIDVNLAGIWDYGKNFKNFVKLFTKCLLHEYIHVDVRLECTPRPLGRGCLPIKYKGPDEEKYVRKLTNIMCGKDYQNLQLTLDDLISNE